MKHIIVLCALIIFSLAAPPSPSCQVTPLPLKLPVSLGETQRFDLENIFIGYNLTFNLPPVDFVSVLDKYHSSERDWQHSMNFTSAKIFGNGRFLAISSDGFNSILYVGTNDESGGVNITKTILVQAISNMRCFDVDELFTRHTTYAVVDCAEFRNGKLNSNEFFYVDLENYTVIETTKITDVFVHYNMLNKRTLHSYFDPRNNIDYLLRVVYMDSVDSEHSNQTYIEIFEVTDAHNPYLVDVIDHTVMGLSSLSIADFKLYDGLMYVLCYNHGIYEMQLTPAQKVLLRTFFEVRMDVNRIAISRLGFNDDINLVLSNGNNMYQYDWIIGKPPTLIAKYSLMPNSEVQHIFVDENFVIVSSKAYYHDEFIDTLYRHIWVFSKRSTSWTNAFATFNLPTEGNFFMHYHEHASVLTVFGNYKSRNIKFYVPFIQMMPSRSSLVNTEVELTISASSVEGNQQLNKTCQQTIHLVIINSSNQSVFGTGLLGRDRYVVDSPDEREIPLGWTYFGPNLKYKAQAKTAKPTKFEPNITVLKTVRYIVKWADAPEAKNVVFIDMFEEKNIHNYIYGLVQDKTNMIYYISCQSHIGKLTITCTTINKADLGRGKITNISQIIDPNERRVALTFDQQPETVYVYRVTPMSISFYGSVSYTGVLENEVTSVSINNGLLMITFALGKRVDVYRLDEVQTDDGGLSFAKPIFRLTSQVMRFFGIQYFAPVDAETSPYHVETLFLKTKTGLIALSINEQGFPEILFQLPVLTEYDYEISRDSILIITQMGAQLYRMDVPLGRNSHPILLQHITHTYKLGQYKELVSDQLFYVTDGPKVQVIHPNRPSNTIFFDEVEAHGNINILDAVKLGNREYLLTVDNFGLSCWELYFEPRLYMDWQDGQPDFNLELSAYNNASTSNVSRLNFTVFNMSESSINLQPNFNKKEASKGVQLPRPENQNDEKTRYSSFSDKDWFNGSVLRYDLMCNDCGDRIQLWNHVEDVREIVAARAILDIQSTYNGVYAQQYDSIFKTWLNDSIESVTQIPTNMIGEPCSKIAVPFHQNFVVSLCQTGTSVNMYITSYATEKPFTWGPSQSEVKQVTTTKMLDMILMIVDNEDNPFSRQGGVYLYHMNLDPEEPEQFALLDLIEADDLQFGGFSGPAYITYADFHRIEHNSQLYRLIMTEGRTGSVFIFTFQLSPSKEEVIYRSKVYINIHKFFLPDTLIPDPLRILTVSITDHILNNLNRSEYTLLLTVANWHHIEAMVTLSYEGDTVHGLSIARLFERYPWTLKPYVKHKPGRNGFFAVAYYNRTIERQLIIVYDMAKSRRAEENVTASDYPLVRLLGSHLVRDVYDISFDFNETNVIGYDNLIFVDIDGYNMTELRVDRNLTLVVRGTPPNQTLKINAYNTFHYMPFELDFGFGPFDNEETVEIVWIIILVLGFMMIIGLILVCVYQLKKEKREQLVETKESLVTQDDAFKHTYINRSSVDPRESLPQFRQSTQS